MINIEDYLQRIDANFKEKSQKDIFMTYAMIFIIIVASSYLLFWDTSEANFQDKRAAVQAIENKIDKDNNFLNTNPENKLSKLEMDIRTLQKDMLKYKDNNHYIKTKIEDISALIYDEQTWGKYLHSVTQNADIYNIKILFFENKYTEKKSAFGHVLDIKMEISGNYINTIKFINALEQSELVIDVHNLEMNIDKKLVTQLNLSVWGITY